MRDNHRNALHHESPTRRKSDEDLEELDIEESDDYLQPIYSPPDEDKYYNTLALKIRTIPVHNLVEYVTKKIHQEYVDEFQQLPSSLIKEITVSQKKENVKKNRYKGICPYDSTLVKLNDETSDYINASYIDGYKKWRAYIACIGPTTVYMDDMSVFWRMVWQEKCGKIVMLTNLDEPQAHRCDRYWPEKEYSCVLDHTTVSLTDEEKFASYVIRTFEIQLNSETRQVIQFHFTAWKEKQLPRDVMSLIEFRQKVNSFNQPSEGPTVVHCSSGVGRTGTYIALDILTKELEAEGRVDIFACVRNLREQRVKMVQTVEQYEFLHQALVRSVNLYSQLEDRRQSCKNVYEECSVAQNAYAPLVFKGSASTSEAYEASAILIDT